MSTLFVDGVATEDTWQFVDGEAPVPEGDDVIVSLQLFKDQTHALVTRNAGRLGVHLEADDQIDEIVDHLDSLSLVSVAFPSFADGRAFSKARLLRDRHGFEGEVRGTGDIRIDQVSHMRRCGCDALLISHQPTIDAIVEGNSPALNLYYQPALGDAASQNGKSWARRAG